MSSVVRAVEAKGLRTSPVAFRLAVWCGGLLLLLVIAASVSSALGAVKVPLSHLASILTEQLGLGEGALHTRTEELVVERVRLPRIVVGGLVGAALGMAGTAMQGLFRNPMADPGIIGVSTGGALGAVLSIAFGLHTAFFFALPLAAFAGSLGTMLLVYGIAAAQGRFSMATLLLSGVAVSSFLGAVISLVILTVPRNDALREILFWLAGGLDSRTWLHAQTAAPLVLGGAAAVLALGRDLNLLMLGDDEAKSLGVRVSVARPVLLVAASLMTGAAVAVSGTIAFVGLVVPHILRLAAGPDNRVLLPASALGGAAFVIIADTLARTLAQPAELRVGILTSLVGAPFFLFLLIRNRRHVEAF